MSGWGINVDKNGTAPASTTAYANSAECLHISDNADAEILFNAISGSYKHRTNKGTAPTSTTAWESSAECLAI